MGERAYIAMEREGGTVEAYYSHWGAMNAYEAGPAKPPVPPNKEGEEVKVFSNLKAFAAWFSYLHIKAIWVKERGEDDEYECYRPVWTWPSNSPVEEWKSDGYGMLIRCATGDMFDYVDGEFSHYLGDILSAFGVAAVTPEQFAEVVANHHRGRMSGDEAPPAFSPQGHGEYRRIGEVVASWNRD